MLCDWLRGLLEAGRGRCHEWCFVRAESSVWAVCKDVLRDGVLRRVSSAASSSCASNDFDVQFVAACVAWGILWNGISPRVLSLRDERVVFVFFVELAPKCVHESSGYQRVALGGKKHQPADRPQVAWGRRA